MYGPYTLYGRVRLCTILAMDTLRERVELRLSADLLEEIDKARGDVPRSVWIRRAIEERLVAQAREAMRR